MIANGGTINWSGKCHNINLAMGEYVLNSPMIAIPMGGANVVLGVQWLQSLGTLDSNFWKLYMGRKRIWVKWYHMKTNKGDKL